MATANARRAATAKRTVRERRSSAALVRERVRELLAASPGYRALPADRRREIAKDTVRVAAYLVNPHGLLAEEFRKPLLAGVVLSRIRARPPRAITRAPETLGMSSEAMDNLVHAVDFPSFVSGLIQGVFNAIVNASIRQMQAYAELIAEVSKAVDEFAGDNISDTSVRGILASEFPQAFCWSGSTARRLRLHAQRGSPSLAKLARTIGLREPVIDPGKANEVKRVVAAARRRVARNRQQILATMVLMGINRPAVKEPSM
jgi:hypothetical protein